MGFGWVRHSTAPHMRLSRVHFTCRASEGNQVLGSVKTHQGRCIAFPNTYQHQAQGFRLIDPTKPGHCKILTLFLVDPEQPILSTSEILPQQGHLIRRAMEPNSQPSLLNHLPSELLDMVSKRVDGSMTLEEAKAFRLELWMSARLF